MTDEYRHRPVDHAPTAGEAWDRASEYIAILDVLGLGEQWSVGVDPDPVPGADNRHGYTVYCMLKPGAVPPQREPGDEPSDAYRGFELGGEG